MTSLEKKCNDKVIEILTFLDHKTNKNGLYCGQAGLSLFNMYYYKSICSLHNNEDIIVKNVIDSFNSINDNNHFEFSFCNGIAGINWMVLLLIENNILEKDEIKILHLLDENLLLKMDVDLFSLNYDFLHGALGIGYYFIKKYNFTQDPTPLIRIVNGLYKMANWENDMCYWLSKVGPEQEMGASISFAHGISSIMVVLSKIYSNGIEQDKCKHLIEGGLNYINFQKRDDGNTSMYASVNIEYDKNPYSRLAWCYGDMGISLAYKICGKHLKNEQWSNIAVRIALHMSQRRDLKINHVYDACFCHGTSGIAQFFNRMYYETQIEEFYDASTYWVEKTLEMASFHDGLAGFKTSQSEKRGGWVNESSLLEGIAGIGLTLLSFYHPKSIEWDKVFLMS